MINIKINGAKNALLPIIAATIIAKNVYHISNFSQFDDIKTQLFILKQFNVSIKMEHDTCIIDTTNLRVPAKIDFSVNTRASYYFIGSSMDYINEMQFEISNGCNIDNRIIDYHIELIKLFDKTPYLKDNILTIKSNNNNITDTLIFSLPKPSVGATINGILMGCKGNKKLVIRNYAKDPYIFDVISFCRKTGANITYDDYEIVVTGTQLLENSCVYHCVIPDPIESLTYILFSSVCLDTRHENISNYTIGPIKKENFGVCDDLLKNMGIELIDNGNDLYRVKNNQLKNFSIKTDFYPGVYTDIQPLLCLWASCVNLNGAVSCIEETIYGNRFEYVSDFMKLGYDVVRNDNMIIIKGKNKNISNNQNYEDIKCHDLRAGIANIMLLRLNNISFEPSDVRYVKRGYNDYEKNIIIMMGNLNVLEKYNTIDISNIKIGGLCKYYCSVNNVSDLISAIKFCDITNTVYKVIGSGTNIYFSEYYDGLIIKCEIKNIEILDNDTSYVKIKLGSGCKLDDLVKIALEHNCDLHQWSGIPGTIGGAVYGNAGAYGLEVKDTIEECEILCIDPREKKYSNQKLSKKEMDFSYRSSIFKKEPNFIILNATFNLPISNKSKDTIVSESINIINIRNSKFPTTYTLGSVFKNFFINDTKHIIASYLEKLNIKGKIIHNIKICDTHSNVMVNSNNATASDLDRCIMYIVEMCKKEFNISPELEIQRIS